MPKETKSAKIYLCGNCQKKTNITYTKFGFKKVYCEICWFDIILKQNDGKENASTDEKWE